ncbi:uncharacterized protein LACBIDRAFT_305110 [Laccaria bicolor S238N-H82]|uniref:Predicted protein n=1 Tax=Laccaria bicolor (strain S238N-H82 / ATCC MYA-4686) TaxID=486041 RepID=B0CTF7_LACBS|nr:uncharacterized protein LACBIDRAFT_305110 [Laccaria bicolor S238N-H82]EDR13912.1 predicted protein [Laccaria bicolor S238N-H82]|eukprot:XP_001874471.1 predicted protein [Laccaria bicolor S238N-H82]
MQINQCLQTTSDDGEQVLSASRQPIMSVIGSLVKSGCTEVKVKKCRTRVRRARFAEVVPGVVFIVEVHMLDTETTDNNGMTTWDNDDKGQ